MAQPFDFANPTFFDLSTRVKLRVTGADAFRFINGQISNDLKKAGRDAAIQASVLSVKGKLNALIFVSAEPDSFLIDSDPEVTDDLPARLERYIIADDVQVENVTDRFGIFHVIAESEALPSQGKVIEVNRFGCRGRDIWFDRTAHDEFFQQLSLIATFCDDECTELGRIERGIPRWGHELTGEIIPIEANLEATSIDYAKGCYIGQEIISRMRSSGQTNKRLSGVVSLSGAPLHSGMRLTTNDEEAREVGWITSATHSQRLDRQIALGYLKRGHTAHGSHYRAISIDPPDASSVPVEVVDLPFRPAEKNG